MEIEEADLRVIVRLLGEAAALPGGIFEKKCYVLDGLCDFSGASEWRWALFSGANSDQCLSAFRRTPNVALLPLAALRCESAPLLSESDLPPATGSPDTILSRSALDAGTESRIALCRLHCERPFTERESLLASVVLDAIPWLHWRDWKTRPEAPKLPPQQQRTLDLLMQGLGRKEIEVRLEISQGTVSGYIRDIYSYFQVNSQSELMRLQSTASQRAGL